MFGKEFNLLFLSIFLAIVIIESNRESSRYPYKTLDNFGNVDGTISELLKLIQSLGNFLVESQDYSNQQMENTNLDDIYDFIVVGAGTAGIAIATRLSEISEDMVLLLEAGYKESSCTDLPLFAYVWQLNHNLNWDYRTEPSDKYCLGMNSKSCKWPRGKGMGGSSVINYMIATRGTAKDYDRWAELGNEGWAYKDVLKYFKKLETIDIPHLRLDTTYHGTKGPLHISYPPFRTPVAEAFIKAAKELKYPIIDYDGNNTIGFSYLKITAINGTRMSSNKAYLQPARNRRNLHVSYDSMVTKILIDPKKNRAIGIRFIKNGKVISVYARKEVILCAGAIGSPQLLMLSGIGPAKHLTKLGIRVIRDAPVGENLMDHVAYPLSYNINESISLRLQDMYHPAVWTNFFTRRQGPVTIPGGCEALGFIDTKDSRKRNGSPDVELLFAGGSIVSDPIIPNILDLNITIRESWKKYMGAFGWSMFTMLLKPKSRGWIKLKANDINVKPEIVPNYFEDPEDMETIIRGIKATIKISRTKAMQAFGSQLITDDLPGCKKYEYNSYAYWNCAVRTIPFTIYHYSGTCKMAPRGDPTAVVDPTLKVIGIERLRVADASIMPEIPSAHTNIPVYMIAEKAADMIKKEWHNISESEVYSY